MKKYLITIIFIIGCFFGYSQSTPVQVKAQHLGFTKDFYFSGASGDKVLISEDTDSTGQFNVNYVADPATPLSAVNLRTLLSYSSGYDSIEFNPLDGYFRAYVSGAVVDSASLDGRYSLIDTVYNAMFDQFALSSTNISVTYSHKFDSTNYYFDAQAWYLDTIGGSIYRIQIPMTSPVLTDSGFTTTVDQAVGYFKYIAIDSTALNGVAGYPVETDPVYSADSAVIKQLARLNAINIKHYGAMGDSVTNDTEIIQQAINTGRAVYFPSGTYSVDSLVLPSKSYIFGNGKGSKIYLRLGATKAIKIQNANNVTIKDISLSGGNEGTIYSLSTTEGTRTGIYISVVDYLKLDNVYLSGFNKDAIYLGEGDNQSISNIHIYTSFKGLDIKALSEYSFYNNINIQYCKFGIYLIGGNNYFSNSNSEHNVYGLYMKRGTNDTHGSFTSSSFNHNTDYAIYSDSIENGQIFSACHVYDADIKLVRSYSVQFNGCYLSPDSLIIEGYCPGSQFAGNVFKNMFTAITRNKAVDFVDFYTNRQYGGAISDAQFYLINDRYNRKHISFSDSLVTSTLTSNTANYFPLFSGTNGRIIKSSNLYTDTQSNLFTTGDTLQIGRSNTSEGTVHLGSMQRAIYNSSGFLILASNFTSGIRFDSRIYGSNSKIEPYANATYDFGSATYYWKDIYTGRLITSGNIGIGVATPYHKTSIHGTTATNLNLFNATNATINKIATNATTASDTSAVSIKSTTTGSITLDVKGKTGLSQFVSDSSKTQSGVPLYYVGTYAGIYVADASTAQAIATGTTYTKSTAFTTNGSSSNCTSDAANDKITITKTGHYLVNCPVSFSGASPSVNWKMAAFWNNVEQPQIHVQRKIGTGGDVGSTTMTGILNVTSVPTDLDVRFRHDQAGSENITIVYSNLTVTYIGE